MSQEPDQTHGWHASQLLASLAGFRIQGKGYLGYKKTTCLFA